VGSLVHPPVVDPGSFDPHTARSQEDLPLSGIAVSYHQGASILVALFFGRLKVGFHFSLQSLGEHPPGSGSGDLVEVEHEFFACLLVLVYPVHIAVYPSRRRCSVGFANSLVGKVHRAHQEICNPQLSSISPHAPRL
jgi:hypothetical protein